MIKPNELRIGNWVNHAKDNPIQVIDIGGSHINGFAIYQRLYGIPLTPEILEKCGARWLGYAYFIGKLKFTYERNELSQFVRFHYSGKVTYLQYLHQLQNLVFALKNEEITINI